MQHPFISRAHHILPLAIAWAAAGTAPSVQAASLTEALTGGTPALDLRLRYENVDQDNNLKDADALTLRTRLGYNTAKFHEFDIYAEMENNAALVEDYNSGPGGNGKTDHSTVSDPDFTEVNQAYLGYTGLPATSVKIGRQRIVYDNARFVGNVGWRQLEQTYDAARVDTTGIPGLTAHYAYIDSVQTVTSADDDMNSHLVNLNYGGLGFAQIAAYGYFLEYNAASGQRANSSRTLGAFVDGGLDLGGAKLLYRAEYAKQDDYQDGNNGIDADYLHLMLGATVAGVTGQVGYELLGADDYSGFETPLATKHAFNGWADVFLNTPVDGIKDVYLAVSGALADVKLTAVYHDFESDRGSTDYGKEIDLQATKSFGKHYDAGIKYASYDADDFAVDTDKFWLWGGLKF